MERLLASAREAYAVGVVGLGGLGHLAGVRVPR
jgi:D-arabinose 1-dehydrogenase-like Zn-dependent alcohol dehydrogenase